MRSDEKEAPIVVGFDGSGDACQALDWAADQALRTGTPLRVVIARGDLYTLSDWADQWTRGLAEERLDLASKQLAEHGLHDADLVISDGIAAAVLVEESVAAGYVVIGRDGRGPIMEGLMGSVRQHVTRHARCPVVVVHDAEAPGAKVVVGVDGSAQSLAALEFALDVAAPQISDVEVVYCPETGDWFSGSDQLDPAPEIRAAIEARHALVREQVRAAGRARGADLVFRKLDERPGRALIDASRGSRLVVVGSRGRGGFRELLLGSVSADVVRHAHCSVAVVR